MQLLREAAARTFPPRAMAAQWFLELSLSMWLQPGKESVTDVNKTPPQATPRPPGSGSGTRKGFVAIAGF